MNRSWLQHKIRFLIGRMKTITREPYHRDQKTIYNFHLKSMTNKYRGRQTWPLLEVNYPI